jgi:hypothetical protein
MNVNRRVNRRGFVQYGLAAAGMLASASLAPAQIFRRNSYLPYEMVPSGPIAPPTPPAPQMTFEVGSGVHPQLMARVVQDYLAMTLSPEYAAGIGQVQPAPRSPMTFHMQFRSDFAIQNPLQPTRTRFGHYLSIQEVVRADAQPVMRLYQDLNFFELRRLIHPAETNLFGVVLYPNSPRQAPTATDQDAFLRVARRLYGVANAEAYTVLYTRLMTDGRGNFMSVLVAPRNDAMRSPYKDLLIDNVPV